MGRIYLDRVLGLFITFLYCAHPGENFISAVEWLQLFTDLSLTHDDILRGVFSLKTHITNLGLLSEAVKLNNIPETFMPLKNQHIEFRFLLVARMLRDKSVGVFMELPRLLRQRWPQVEVCGCKKPRGYFACRDGRLGGRRCSELFR